MNNTIFKYLISSEGEWNYPSINSKILGINIKGYIPKYHGGCIGIIPNNDKFLLLAEDDDYYWDIYNLSFDELLTLKTILFNLYSSIEVKIDYKTATSISNYKKSKKAFFNKNFSLKGFKVNVFDRGKTTSPLITILHNNKNIQFDVYWAKARYLLFNQIINDLSK